MRKAPLGEPQPHASKSEGSAEESKEPANVMAEVSAVKTAEDAARENAKNPEYRLSHVMILDRNRGRYGFKQLDGHLLSRSQFSNRRRAKTTDKLI